MKRYFVILLLPLLLLISCIWEHPFCETDNNLVLRLRLLDTNGNDQFTNKILSVDIIIFDTRNNFVRSFRFDKTAFDSKNRVAMSLVPGIYRIICWANVTDHSKIMGAKQGGNFKELYLEERSSDTGSPVYYAPAGNISRSGSGDDFDYTGFTVILPADKITEKTMDLRRVHRTINIYILGLENLAGFDGLNPKVQAKNMPFQYDFTSSSKPGRRDYIMTTQQNTRSALLYTAGFHSPAAAFSDDMAIHLLNSSGNIQLTDGLNLKAWVEENPPQDTCEFGILFTITKTSTGVCVTVTKPDWEDIDVKPGDI
ncbi:MAG TPA: FimB/Mfa2 family fimbrial subunit [Petrimonas sp.]|uniref:FimB/Mfa2 family fimbrial subunit n=1 Tax=Petrimonas sp. TaxID=2023866 RepID=UPI0017735BBA|nr:FimB/Mfa2 family fimbrial subunit [Petrimonas sp.]